MAVFVLVHGSWAGGWQWRPIRDALESQGHTVYAPTLTGMGDRFHLATEETGLSTHIDDIARLIEWERETDVILVGHSYGGMVITGVAMRLPDRIRHLIYVDAFLPRAGECAWDILPWQREGFETLRLETSPWLVRPVEIVRFFPELKDFDESRLTPMPIKTHQEPLPNMAAPKVPATYIHSTQEPAYFNEVAERARSDGMKIETIKAGHLVLVSHPHEVTQIMLNAAKEY